MVEYYPVPEAAPLLPVTGHGSRFIGKSEGHRDMRNSRVHEFLSVRFEAVPRVKRRGPGLRMQCNHHESPLSGKLEKIFEQRASRSLPPPIRQNSEPANTAIGQESASSDRRVFRGVRERVLAALILSIPLQLQGNTLLFDEDLQPYGAQGRGIGSPAGRFDDEVGFWSHGCHYNYR